MAEDPRDRRKEEKPGQGPQKKEVANLFLYKLDEVTEMADGGK